MENERHSQDPRGVITRFGKVMGGNIHSVALLNRGIGSCNGNYSRKIGFTGLLEVLGSIRNSFMVHFVASRPGSYAIRLLSAVHSYGGMDHRLRLPFRDKDDHVLGLVGHCCSHRDCLRLVGGTGRHLPSIGLADSVVIKFPNRACSSFGRALDLMGRIGFTSLFAFVCSGHGNAPTTVVSSPVAQRRGNG